jgi:hypothetical protein
LDCSEERLGGKRFADEKEDERQVRKWLRQQSKDFYAAGKAIGQVYRCWWGICQEIHIFFQVRISHVLRFISICDLFTDFPRKI